MTHLISHRPLVEGNGLTRHRVHKMLVGDTRNCIPLVKSFPCLIRAIYLPFFRLFKGIIGVKPHGNIKFRSDIAFSFVYIGRKANAKVSLVWQALV